MSRRPATQRAQRRKRRRNSHLRQHALLWQLLRPSAASKNERRERRQLRCAQSRLRKDPVERALPSHPGQGHKSAHPRALHRRVTVMLRLGQIPRRKKTRGSLPRLLQLQNEQRRVCFNLSSKCSLRRRRSRRASSRLNPPGSRGRNLPRGALRRRPLVQQRHLKQLNSLVVPGRPLERVLQQDESAYRRCESRLGDQHGILRNPSSAHRLGCCQRRPLRPHTQPLLRGPRLHRLRASRLQERLLPPRPLDWQLQPPRWKDSRQRWRHLRRSLPSLPRQSRWRQPLGRRPRLPHLGPQLQR